MKARHFGEQRLVTDVFQRFINLIPLRIIAVEVT
jgi:hypothetical protein